MKLIGSLTEKHIREELLMRQESFQSHQRYSEALLAVGITGSHAKSVVALDSFPDSDSDYVILILPNTTIAKVSIPYSFEQPVEVESKTTLNEYRIRLSRNGQIHLAIALEIAESQA